MKYRLAVCAIAQLEPRVLIEVDTEGHAPFVYIIELLFDSRQHPEINDYETLENTCKVLLHNGTIETAADTLRAMTGACIPVSMHGLVEKG